MIAQYLDVTKELNTTDLAIIDASNYDYCLIQAIGISDLVFISSFSQYDHYYGVSTTKISDNSLVQYTNQDGIYRIDVVGRYVIINGRASKVLVMLAKIG
jgi:hypothetical protein